MLVDEADKDEVGGGSGTHGTNSGDRSGTNVIHPTWTPLLHSSQENAHGPFPQYVVVRRPTSPLPLSSPDISSSSCHQICLLPQSLLSFPWIGNRI